MTDVLVGAVQAIDVNSHQLLQLDPAVEENDSFSVEQRKDPEILEMIVYLSDDQLPECEKKSRRCVLQASIFTLVDGVLYYLDPKREHRRRCVVPCQLRSKVMEENHSGPMSGHGSLYSLDWTTGLNFDLIISPHFFS